MTTLNPDESTSSAGVTLEAPPFLSLLVSERLLCGNRQD